MAIFGFLEGLTIMFLSKKAWHKQCPAHCCCSLASLVPQLVMGKCTSQLNWSQFGYLANKEGLIHIIMGSSQHEAPLFSHMLCAPFCTARASTRNLYFCICTLLFYKKPNKLIICLTFFCACLMQPHRKHSFPPTFSRDSVKILRVP